MNVRLSSLLTATALLGALSFVPSRAHAAALDKCGGIFLTAASACEFKPVQDCMTTCSTTSVEQTCAQQTYTTCSSGCTVTDTTSCTKTHSDSCAQECDSIASQSSHDVCTSECTNNCTSDAVSKGEFGADQGKCGEACGHDCDAQCDSCSTTDQSTDCMTKCMSITTSECNEEVNRDCVLDCQTTNFESCQTTTVNTCNTSCTDKGGAIFCDGQFVDAENLQDCADQLASEFSFNIDVTAHVNVSGDGTVTTTNSDGSKTTTKCSYSGAPVSSNGMLIAGLGAVAFAVARRRRRS